VQTAAQNTFCTHSAQTGAPGSLAEGFEKHELYAPSRQLCNRLTFEKKHIILNEAGVSLSQSLFVPFGIMDQSLLYNISQLLESSNTRCVFNDTKKRESVIFALEHVEILGVVDVITGLTRQPTEGRRRGGGSAPSS